MSDAMALRQLLEKHTMKADAALVKWEEGEAVRCAACCNRCLMFAGESGICQVRFNEGGELRVPAGYVAGLQVDPIEKKPFFHVMPGRDALSFGMLGCDLHCDYCQNWLTSQALRDEKAVVSPHMVDADSLVLMALQEGAPMIVSTYNEPLITSEWAVEVFTRAKEKGLKCGFVSNGNATPEVIDYLRPHMDMYKVDLKTFNDDNYARLGARLRNILDAIERLKASGFWVEVVTLVVPGFNDGKEELGEIARFIAGLSDEIPWHVTAFHPTYKMTDPPATSSAELMRAYDAGKDAGLKFVYTGNLPGALADRENTYCPECSTLLLERRGFSVVRNRMTGSMCGGCGAEIPGIWEEHPPASGHGGYPRAVSMF